MLVRIYLYEPASEEEQNSCSFYGCAHEHRTARLSYKKVFLRSTKTVLVFHGLAHEIYTN